MHSHAAVGLCVSVTSLHFQRRLNKAVTICGRMKALLRTGSQHGFAGLLVSGFTGLLVSGSLSLILLLLLLLSLLFFCCGSGEFATWVCWVVSVLLLFLLLSLLSQWFATWFTGWYQGLLVCWYQYCYCYCYCSG